MLGNGEDPNHRLIQRRNVLRGLQRDGTIMVTSSHWEHVKRLAIEAGASVELVERLTLVEPATEQERRAEADLLKTYGWGGAE